MTQILLFGSLLLILLLFVMQTLRLRQRNRDIEAATASLVRREKMASLGTMLAGIAHELNTPLGAVACTIDTRKRALTKLGEALDAFPDDGPPGASAKLEQAHKALKVVRDTEPVLAEAMSRAEQLVRHLRLQGRGETEDPQPVDVNELLRGSLLLLRHELKNEVTVELDLGVVPPVMGWPGPLGQVFLNLIMNARQALEGPGTIRVSSAAADGMVTVSVADSGPGLPEGCLDHLFEAGWSTKSADDGTGMGLFISKKIVDQHAGASIEAADGPEGGAVFTVALTAAKDPALRTAP